MAAVMEEATVVPTLNKAGGAQRTRCTTLEVVYVPSIGPLTSWSVSRKISTSRINVSLPAQTGRSKNLDVQKK